MAHVWVVEERLGGRWVADHRNHRARKWARRSARRLREAWARKLPGYATRVRKYVREEA